MFEDVSIVVGFIGAAFGCAFAIGGLIHAAAVVGG